MLKPFEPLSYLKHLVEDSYLQNAHLLTPDKLKELTRRPLEAAVAGQVTIAEREVVLCVGIDERFPLSLPRIYLRPADAFGFIPHVEEDGYICYRDEEGLLLDAENPVGILHDAIALSVELLLSCINGQNRWDFMNEFAIYWQKVNSQKGSLPSFIAVDERLRKVFAYKDGRQYVLLADDLDLPQAYYNSYLRELNLLTRYTALYVPLKENTFIFPPRPDRLWNQRQIQEIVRQNLSIENLKAFQDLTRKWKTEELVILGLPRPRGGKTLVGFLFTDVVGGHPLRVGGSKTVPIPLSLQRYDPDYLSNRGGAMKQLSRYKVLVVGCGSVGGYIVAGLVQAGFTNLTLVDPDLMKPENTFRHFLGRQAEKQPKVIALKEEMEKKYPYLSIETHAFYIEKAIRERSVDLSKFDLAIFATGDPTVELYLNRLLHQGHRNPIALFTWLEPYGIGGHSLLTRPERAGCLQCLFKSDPTTDTPLHNRASFAAHSQSFGKDDLGCGNSFTPYGALDAWKTAEQTVHLAIDALIDRERKNPIRSWKGSEDSLVGAGFKVSARYRMTTDQLYENRYSYTDPTCPVCGGGSQ
jgi:molybdopterin/thiamine biosynthesis adenylyltransferase